MLRHGLLGRTHGKELGGQRIEEVSSFAKEWGQAEEVMERDVWKTTSGRPCYNLESQ